MLASKPLVAASVILPGILILGYLWQKRREEEVLANNCDNSNLSAASSTLVDSKEVSLKLESLNRSRLDCIEEERSEECSEATPVDQVGCAGDIAVASENLDVNPLSKSVSGQDKEIVGCEVSEKEIVTEASEVRSVINTIKVESKESTIKAEKMTTEESVEVTAKEAIPDVLAALKDPILSPLSTSPTSDTCSSTGHDSAAADPQTADHDDSASASPVKSEVSQKSESWSDLIEEEDLELVAECARNNMLNTYTNKMVTPGEESGRNDSGVASPTEDFSRPETVAVEEKARISSGEDAGIGGSETDDVSDGQADLASEDSQLFSYHFYIQDYLTGNFIGARGTSINKLKTSCQCNVIVRDDNSIPYQRRGKFKSRDRRYGDGSMNLVILEGTRANIDKCLDTIRERFKNYPELTLEQMNKPENTSLSLNAGSVALSLVEGIMHDVVISSIVYGDHIFIQQPTNPTFPALERLDACMYNTYSQLTCPGLTKPIASNSICVAPSNGGWFRCQVLSYDESEDTCSVKYVDYGGFDVLPADQLKQIRTDFLSLPFQAIECRLANIVVPDGDTVCTDLLQELVDGQVIQARMLGVDEDNLPMVHIYRNSNGQTVMVNRELVDRNCADWIESKFVALPEGQDSYWNTLGDFSPSNDHCNNYQVMQVKYFQNLPNNYCSLLSPLPTPPLPSYPPPPLCHVDFSVNDDVFLPTPAMCTPPPPPGVVSPLLPPHPYDTLFPPSPVSPCGGGITDFFRVPPPPLFTLPPPALSHQHQLSTQGDYNELPTESRDVSNLSVSIDNEVPARQDWATAERPPQTPISPYGGRGGHNMSCPWMPEVAVSPRPPCHPMMYAPYSLSGGDEEDDDDFERRAVSESPTPMLC